jgi:hypothetical protein
MGAPQAGGLRPRPRQRGGSERLSVPHVESRNMLLTMKVVR